MGGFGGVMTVARVSVADGATADRIELGLDLEARKGLVWKFSG